jgi:hypothetical protein
VEAVSRERESASYPTRMLASLPVHTVHRANMTSDENSLHLVCGWLKMK